MKMPKLALGIGGALFALLVGLILGAGLSAMDAAGREGTPPEGWTFTQMDSLNIRALPAGPLRPRRDRMSLSAQLGITRETQWLTGLDMSFELPKDGVLQIELKGLLNNPTVVLLLQAGDEKRGGALWALQTMVNNAGYGSAPEPDRGLLKSDPETLPLIQPGLHALSVNFRESPWTLMLDGATWGTCDLQAQSFSGITLTPGQNRIQILKLVRHELNQDVTEHFGQRRYDASRLAGGALFVLLLGEILARAGARRRDALLAVVPLAATLPLTMLDLRVVAVRFRLLPMAADRLPGWLAIAATLIALALLPTEPTKLGRALRRWGCALTLLAVVVQLFQHQGMLAAAMAVAAFPAMLAWTLGLGDGPTRILARSWAFTGFVFALGLVEGPPWNGHVILFGGLVGALSTIPELSRAALRPGRVVAWSLGLLLALTLGSEVLVRAGPQDQAWSSAALVDPVPGTPGAVARSGADLIPSDETVDGKCQVDRANFTSSVIVTVFGGSASATGVIGFRNQYFPKLLEWKWNADNPSNTIQVLNQAIPGWTSFEIARCAPKLIDTIGPTLVILYLGWEDTSGPGSVLYRIDRDRQEAKRSSVARFMDRSSLVRLFRYGLSGFMHRGNALPVPVGDARRNIEIVANAARHVGAKTLVVSEATFPRANALDSYRAMLRELAASRPDVEYLDASAIFQDYMDPSYFGDDYHLTTVGHKQLVQVLEDTFSARPELLGG